MAIDALFNNVYSICLLTFSIVVALALIFTRQSWFSSAVHIAYVCDCMISATVWLSLVQGGKASLVGLVPLKSYIYKDTHPSASLCTATPQKGDNLNRYLLGRQFVVVLIAVIVNMTGASLPVSELLVFPPIMMTGFAMILFTCMVGQTNVKVNTSHSMLNYIHAYFEAFTLYAAMAIEFSGLSDSSHLIQVLKAEMSSNKIESNEGQTKRSAFFWARCLMSLAIFGSCFAVTFEGLVAGKTNMWEGVPEAVPVVFFFFLVSVVGLAEAMQNAFFDVAKLHEGERGEAKLARIIYDLLCQGGIGSLATRRKGRGTDGRTGMRPRVMSTAMSGKRQLRR